MASESRTSPPPDIAIGSATAPILIPDTNVALDVFLFERDELLNPLRQAVQSHAVQLISTPWAAEEFHNILKLDKIPGSPERRDHAWQRFCKEVKVNPLPPKTTPTPKCADRDDQEFIDLAVATGATWLLSRDKKVLKLDKRFIKLELPTRIMHPLEWCRQWQLSS